MNDLYSHLENWPRIRRFLDQRRRESEKKEKTTTIAVDLGDFVDRWHPLSEAANGQENVSLMDEVGYNTATIEDNEGVRNSKEELNHLYNHAGFGIILNNLFDRNTPQPPARTKPYKIIATKHQAKIGLVVFTAPFPLTYNSSDWDIRSPYDILPELVEDLRSQVDVLVLMSHLGIQNDLQIAREILAIDVILGSHTHHLFKEGHVINGVQIAAAGEYEQYVGEVHLTIGGEKKTLRHSAKAIPTEAMTASTEGEQEVNSYLERGHELLKEKEVADLPFSLGLDIFNEHSLIQVTFEVVKERKKAEAAILNSGLFLAKVPKGRVNQSQLHTALPHPIHLLNVTLGGNDLIRLVLEIEKNHSFLRDYPMKRMGFRGKIFGQMVYSGITYDSINHQVFWKNRPIDLNKNYIFTTVDHSMFVPSFPTIEIAGKDEFLFPEFIRSMVGDYLKAHYPIK